MKTVIFAYIPVLHRGYMDFLERHPEAREIVLLDREIIAKLGPEFDYIVRKDMLRAVPARHMQQALAALLPARSIFRFGDYRAVGLDSAIMPGEDVMRAFASRHLAGCDTAFDPVFLRYDRTQVQKKEDAMALATESLEPTAFASAMLSLAFMEAERSWDWWRQVGAVLARDGEVLLWARNQHVPSEQSPNAYGDPRALFKSGEEIEVTTAQHAESRLIGEAARRGIMTEGADLYITTFPCGPCMAHVGSAGVKRVFFVQGSYGLNTPEILEWYGIKAFRVAL